MTAMVERQTIDEIVAGLRLYGLTELLDEAGQMLADENESSVHHLSDTFLGTTTTYAYKPVAVAVGQLARSINHYCTNAYQSPTWPESEARAMCLRLAFAMLENVPGYHEAEAR